MESVSLFLGVVWMVLLAVGVVRWKYSLLSQRRDILH